MPRMWTWNQAFKDGRTRGYGKAGKKDDKRIPALFYNWEQGNKKLKYLRRKLQVRLINFF